MARAKKAAPNAASLKASTSKAATPKAATPKVLTTKGKAPKATTSKAAIPKVATTKAAASKAATAKALTTKGQAPKSKNTKAPIPKQTTRKAATAKAPTPTAKISTVTTLVPITPRLVTGNLGAANSTASASTNCEVTRTFDPLDYMTVMELDRIDQQLARSLRGVDVLVFWTGVDWGHVQKWARIWKLKTLTIAMGPLMDPANPDSPKAKMSTKTYSRYVKGASGRFADYARQHCRVVVLTNPPPDIYSPRENNTYQQLEEPILKGLCGGSTVRRIDYVHPTVTGAAHVTYQSWPCDKSKDWAGPFGVNQVRKWKKLNWSYQSLITTSQIGLTVLQRQQQQQQQQQLPAASTLDSNTLPVSNQPDSAAMNALDGSANLSDQLLNGLNKGPIAREDGSTIQPREYVNCVKKQQPLPVADTPSHECEAPAYEQGQCEPETNESLISGPLAHDQADRLVDVCEVEPACKPEDLSTPAYSIKRCAKPVLPNVLPIICIDDIAVGAQVSMRVDGDHLVHDFLYLTMRSQSGRENWWKVSWS